MLERMRDYMSRHPRLMAGSAIGAVVLVGLAVGLASGVFGEEPTADASQVPSASASPSASPSSTPPASATGAVESATPSRAPGFLRVEGFASVVVDRLNMRLEPGLDADVVREFIADCPPPCFPLQVGSDTRYSELYLLDGPVQADGYAWYLAATVSEYALTTEYIGWVAAGDEDGAWLVPHEPDCPQPPIELSDLTYPSLSRFEAIACFGGEALTVRGWYVDLPADAEPPGQCANEPAWLVCGWGYHMLRPQPSGWYGGGNNLPMKVDPASNIQMPPRGNWVLVTGMWDHPGAQACGSDAQEDVAFRLTCRMEFVVTSARLAE